MPIDLLTLPALASEVRIDTPPRRRTVHVTQVTPTTYSRNSVIGGGEKHVLYADHALRRAAEASGLALTTSVLSFGAERGAAYLDHDVRYEMIPGRPWDATSVDVNDLIPCLREADAVYVDQCLCPVGMLVAAHARLLGRRVVGKDAGGGEHPILRWNTEAARIYDAFHALSEFAAGSFSAFDVPVHVVPGPVDTDMFIPPVRPERDPRLVVAVGRIMPHKGFDRIVDALPPTLSLTIIGQHYDAQYASYLQERAHGKDVTLRSELDDTEVRTLLQRAGLFVLASTHFDYRGHYYHKPELLGLAPLEALSCGLPTLVSNAGSLPELARIPGCLCFQDNRELAEILRAHAAGTLMWPAEIEMHTEVEARYGPLAAGRALLAIMDLL
jgi:glycosyltransferase involved in cell wall biosynthesis